MSEYPKLMYVSDVPITLNNTKIKDNRVVYSQARRIVLCKYLGFYYAARGDLSLNDFLALDYTEDTVEIVKWRYAVDIPQPQKRPMTIFEFQDFTRNNNFLIRNKMLPEWRTLTYARFTEAKFQETIGNYQYKLEDGTIGEFEVDA